MTRKEASHRASHGPCHGWTLIELIAVVTLMSVVYAGAVFTLKAPLARRQVRQDVDRVQLIDRISRSEAIRFRRRVHLDFRIQGDASYVAVRRGTETRRHDEEVELPTLRRVRTVNGDRDSGDVRVVIDKAGRSTTYAMEFASAAKNESTWLIVAGATGQGLKNLSTSELEGLLDVLEMPTSH